MKVADITPNHQKGKRDMKEKFRLVIILLVLSKIFKKILFIHIFDYFEDIFDKQQHRFYKDYNIQQRLLKILKKWKSSAEESRVFGVLLTDLFKAFDCLDHEFLIAYLKLYLELYYISSYICSISRVDIRITFIQSFLADLFFI